MGTMPSLVEWLLYLPSGSWEPCLRFGSCLEKTWGQGWWSAPGIEYLGPPSHTAHQSRAPTGSALPYPVSPRGFLPLNST